MAVEAAIVFRIIDSALKFLGLVHQGQMQYQKGYDEALGPLYDALNETQIYIAELHRGDKPNREKEADLSRRWRLASRKLRPIDRKLAEICFHKGTYWINPEEWSQDDIQKANIGINKVCKLAKEMLNR
jgi:hypothetical protein